MLISSRYLRNYLLITFVELHRICYVTKLLGLWTNDSLISFLFTCFSSHLEISLYVILFFLRLSRLFAVFLEEFIISLPISFLFGNQIENSQLLTAHYLHNGYIYTIYYAKSVSVFGIFIIDFILQQTIFNPILYFLLFFFQIIILFLPKRTRSIRLIFPRNSPNKCSRTNNILTHDNKKAILCLTC